MFAFPQAKRIRREDLYSRLSSPPSSPDPGIQEAFRLHCAKHFDDTNPPPPPAPPAVHATPPPVSNDHHIQPDHPANADPESPPPAQPKPFRLFLPSPHPAPPFVQPRIFPSHRPDSYYFTPPRTPLRLAQLSSVALTGADVLRHSLRACPGLAYPWRVIPCISACGGGGGGGEGGQDGDGEAGGEADGERERKRRRAGKKARIKRRKRGERVRQRERAREVAEEGKAAHEREKRRRLNRVKQVRKREKERERKKGAAGDRVGLVGVGVEGDSKSL